jgi:hypothetical protein
VADLGDEGALLAALIPPDRALQALPAHHLEPAEANLFVNGGFCAPPPGLELDAVARVLGPGEAFLGMGRVVALEGQGLRLKPERLLHL